MNTIGEEGLFVITDNSDSESSSHPKSSKNYRANPRPNDLKLDESKIQPVVKDDGDTIFSNAIK